VGIIPFPELLNKSSLSLLAEKTFVLSGWKRSLCKGIDYPEFGDPELITLPDVLAEKQIGFSGLACYDTIFVLDETPERPNGRGRIQSCYAERRRAPLFYFNRIPIFIYGRMPAIV
jgi:hypothetical protein